MRRRHMGHMGRAFSMLEITLVIAIIGLLMAVVAYNMIGAGNASRIRLTKVTMQQIKNVLDQYNLEKGTYPSNLTVLVTGNAAMLKEDALADSWKRPLTYVVPGPSGKPYGLYSAGIDGEPGTADDIDIWNLGKD